MSQASGVNHIELSVLTLTTEDAQKRRLAREVMVYHFDLSDRWLTVYHFDLSNRRL